MPEISRLGKQQSFEWGTILWFVEPGDLDVERMSVGLVTFHPGALQEEHLHSGDEQVIYVVAGAGTQIIDGEAYRLRPGDIKHIPPYTRHKVINDSPAELKLIIVYTPSKFQSLLAQAPSALRPPGEADLRALLDTGAIGGLLNKLSEAIGLSLSLIDTAGEHLVKTDNYPAFCALLGGAAGGSHCGRHIKKAIGELDRIDGPHLFLCCNDVAGIIIPVFDGSTVIGYIRCGQVFLSKPDAARLHESLAALAARHAIPLAALLAGAAAIPIEPKSRLYSAAEATFAIANCVTEMAVAALRQKELDNSRLSLAREQMASAQLEQALREADFKLLQSRINPHFLFNTLGTIAQMAYIDGAERVADLVWSLSDLLRFTLRKSEELVPLREELKMLANYLHIQQTRFGDRLRVAVAVEPGLDETLIPCMLLQPLVENAIVHGFEPGGGAGSIGVAIRRHGGRLHCRVEDDGQGFDPESAPAGKGGIGLDSVRNRLEYYFRGQYLFAIHSRAGEGTAIELSFPAIGGDRHA
jgi:quercetin dioxygenase-like cupin family protein/ligand-binding sensor protein/two-component sensor histidine kinase